MKKYIVAVAAALTIAGNASAQTVETVYTSANGVMTAPNMKSQAEDNRLRNSLTVRDMTYEVIENGYVDEQGNFIPSEGDTHYTVTATGQNLTGWKIWLGGGIQTVEGHTLPVAKIGLTLDCRVGAISVYGGWTQYQQNEGSAFEGKKENSITVGLDLDKYWNLTPKGTAANPIQNWRWLLITGISAEVMRTWLYDPLQVSIPGATVNGMVADDGSLVYKSTGHLLKLGAKVGVQYRISNLASVEVAGKYQPFLHFLKHEGGISGQGWQVEAKVIFNLSKGHPVAPTTAERAAAIEQYEAQMRNQYIPNYFAPAK
jgi:hypothetical protein